MLNFKNLDFNKIFKNYPIQFVYLFGSFAKDQAKQNSDIDIAVCFSIDVPEDRIHQIHMELISELSKLLKNDKIDIIILNSMPVFFAFRVIKEGNIIFCPEEYEILRIRYEQKIMSLYFDYNYYYKRHAQININTIAQEGL